MKFVSGVILIALLSAVAEYFMPWWSMAVVCFLIALFVKQRGGAAFLMGFTGVALFWLVAALAQDMANRHILAARMAALFHLPGYGLFIGVTVLIGGLTGGLAAWTGNRLKPQAVS